MKSGPVIRYWILAGIAPALMLFNVSCRKNETTTQITSASNDILKQVTAPKGPSLVIAPVITGPKVDAQFLRISGLNAKSESIGSESMIRVTLTKPENASFLQIAICNDSGVCNPSKEQPFETSRPEITVPTPLKGVLQVFSKACVRADQSVSDQDDCGEWENTRVKLKDSEESDFLNLFTDLSKTQTAIREESEALRNDFIRLRSFLQTPENTYRIMSEEQYQLLYSYIDNFIKFGSDGFAELIQSPFFESHLIQFIKQQQQAQADAKKQPNLSGSSQNLITLSDDPVYFLLTVASLPSEYMGLSQIDPGESSGLRLAAPTGPVNNTLSSREYESQQAPQDSGKVIQSNIGTLEAENSAIKSDIKSLETDLKGGQEKFKTSMDALNKLGKENMAAAKLAEAADMPTNTASEIKAKNTVATAVQNKANVMTELNLLFTPKQDGTILTPKEILARQRALKEMAKGNTVSPKAQADIEVVQKAAANPSDAIKKQAQIIETADYLKKVTDLELQIRQSEIDVQLKQGQIDDLKVKQSELDIKATKAKGLTAASILTNIFVRVFSFRLAGLEKESHQLEFEEHFKTIYFRFLNLLSILSESTLIPAKILHKAEESGKDDL